MGNNKKKIIGIIVVAVAIILIIAIISIVAAKKDKSTETAQPVEQTEAPKISGSVTKSKGGNTTLSSVDITSKTSTGKKKMEEYEIIGQIEIPAIDLKCNILDEVTKRSIEIAVAKMYTTDGLNKPGNTVIYGHNYRNSLFFSRNDELKKGDEIYISDEETGEKITYEIYDIFETTMSDTSFYSRTSEITGGKREVTLSTCTDDASDTDRRLIVQAVEK